MRVLQLTPGTGSFHCGSCLRDNALVKALRVRGHDALLLPLYLPLVTDVEEANPERPSGWGAWDCTSSRRFRSFTSSPSSSIGG
jgi:hypothetical protein